VDFKYPLSLMFGVVLHLPSFERMMTQVPRPARGGEESDDGKTKRKPAELGTGFAFIDNQYHLTVGDEDYYIDLLFYNLKLRCYVAVELKTGKFKPEYAGYGKPDVYGKYSTDLLTI
jgi:hypothetical protein